MDWFELRPTGAVRDLWVDATGHDDPRWGRWTLADGRDAHNLLAAEGPAALGVPVWWAQTPESYGKRLRDWLWQTGGSGVKLVSDRLAALLVDAEPRVRTVDVDVRWRSGDPVTGYVGVLEPVDDPGPVHSLYRGRRVGALQVSASVRDAVREAGLTGLRVEPADPDVPFSASEGPDPFSSLPELPPLP